jgi:hypothetical protein
LTFCPYVPSLLQQAAVIYRSLVAPYWMDRAREIGLRFCIMPLIELSDSELRDAAQAARMAAHRAQQDAAAQPNPRISATFAADVERYGRLAAKFESSNSHGLTDKLRTGVPPSG